VKTPRMDTTGVRNHGGRKLRGAVMRVGVPAVAAIVFTLLAPGFVQALAVPRLAESRPSASQRAVPAETKQKLARLQIPFVANEG
jgi:hypothetical protein